MMRTLLSWIAWLLYRIFARLEIEGLEKIPRDRNFILTINHLGFLDAPMSLVAVRMVHLKLNKAIVVVAEKYQKYPLVRWLVNTLDFLFLDRFNPDPRAVREVYRRLRDGGYLLIAPEGTRSQSASLIEGKPGTAYLAAKSGVEIIPAGMTGTEDAIALPRLRKLRRVDIHVVIGEPYSLPPLPRHDRDAFLQAQTDEIMCRIAALLPERYRGIYAEHPRLKELLAKGKEAGSPG